jgi:predicted TPR repeat methyltransferase
VILARLGREEEELAVHERIAALAVSEMGIAPEHQGAAIAFELATIGIGVVPAKMPQQYTAALFDKYAPFFDKNLRDDLGYRAPEHLNESLLRAVGTRMPGSLDIFDIGCGTGLLGPLLRNVARRLDGVDCSPRMLDQARALGLYDDLVEDDLTAALTCRPNQYDVVTAADVFVYIGDLAPAFIAVAISLRPGGLVAFTVEVSADEQYQLTSSGRFGHAPAFVREAAAAAGLIEVSVDAVILRKQQSSLVEGMVWVFRKQVSG